MRGLNYIEDLGANSLGSSTAAINSRPRSGTTFSLFLILVKNESERALVKMSET